MAVAWSEDGYGDAGFGGITSASVTLTALEASGVVGSVSTLSETFLYPTGVSATGAVGESEPVENNVWGGSTWGTPEGWGGVLSANVVIDTNNNLQITGVVGTVATKSENFIMLTGLSVAGSVGTASISGTANFSVSGVSGTGIIGEEEVSADVNTAVTGVVTTGFIESVGTNSGAVITPAGVQATVALSEEEIYGNATVYLTGVSSVGSIGTATIRGTSTVDVTGVLGTVALGEADAQADAGAFVTSVTASGYVGSVTNTGDAFVYLTGVSAAGLVARPLVWGLIDTAQNPDWIPIAA